MSKLKQGLSLLVGVCIAAQLAGCSQSSDPASSGRSATVLELGATYGVWTGLDPLTNLSASINHDFFNAIYGQLFRRGAHGQLVGDLATGYHVKNGGLDVVVTLRHGVRFSDGTPFDAAAVAFNLQRDLAPAAACRCLANFAKVASVSPVGTTAVALHLKAPDPAIIGAFIDAAPNWIISPRALRRMGEKDFAITPVGAGPFTVASDHLNSSLELVANKKYWHAGYPKLKRLTFTSVADDTAAYNAMRAGQAQIYMDFGTPALLAQMKSRFNAVPTPATQTEAININPKIGPLKNVLAREALYYATDTSAINTHVLKGAGTVSQSPGGPADLYWHAKVPGYRGYDLQKARAIVTRLHGLSFTLSALNTPIQSAIAEALQSQWARAGIKARLELISIPQAIAKAHNGTLQAIATQVGSYNPALVPGLAASYSSTGPFSLVRDDHLDTLIADATAETTPGLADEKWLRVYVALSDGAYAPLLSTMNQWNIATRSVHGLTPTDLEVNWEAVSVG